MTDVSPDPGNSPPTSWLGQLTDAERAVIEQKLMEIAAQAGFFAADDEDAPLVEIQEP